MEKKEIKMAGGSSHWDGNGRKTKDITLCVTEDCNLLCKYCYMTGKNSKKKMDFETAKKVVDYILSDRKAFPEGAVVWNFIGGEPFLEIDLIDEICDYIKQKTLLLNHPWFEAYRFSFSTNGILYDNEKVQKYILKNKGHISVGISVDGNKLKHDLQRIYPDGSGSYDDVIKNVPLWIKQFGDVQTKATYAHDDLPHIKDSIISLWNNDIKIVAANIVFEDEWAEGDDILFEQQLKELADYVIDNKLWDECYVRFFDHTIGFPIEKNERDRNFCGAGRMLAIDCDGNFYPCVRFLDLSLNSKKGIKIGDYKKGVDEDKIRPFYGLYYDNQSPEKCIKCEVASGCSWCTGYNYDAADTDTVYQRAVHLCKMHKANVRATEYFWNRYSQITGAISPREEYIRERYLKNQKTKYLQLITEDNAAPHCRYKNKEISSNTVMGKETIEAGLSFAAENGYIPIFIGNQSGSLNEQYKDYLFVLDSTVSSKPEQHISVYDNKIHDGELDTGIATLLLDRLRISHLSEYVEEFNSKGVKRLNIVLGDIENWIVEDLNKYQIQLDKLLDIVIQSYEDGSQMELNILTDRLNLKTFCDCDAGNDSIALAPNGKFYICPAFYFEDKDDHVGDISIGVNIKNKQLLDISNSAICTECDAYHCMRCKFLNKKMTGEINTPSRKQCVVSHLERNASKRLQERLIMLGYLSDIELMKEIRYLDPLEKLKLKDNYGGGCDE